MVSSLVIIIRKLAKRSSTNKSRNLMALHMHHVLAKWLPPLVCVVDVDLAVPSIHPCSLNAISIIHSRFLAVMLQKVVSFFFHMLNLG